MIKLLVIISCFVLQLYAQQISEGQLLHKDIPAHSLTGNFFKIPTEQPIAIYLPPSYNSSEKRYSVVYFLPGFGDAVLFYTNFGIYQGFTLKESMDQLIAEGKSKEMIVVIVNGTNFLGGSFYVNSPVTGNWENFVVRDVVNYLDSNYRTIKSPASRGIAGHSMGGFGAINIAMKYPDIFSNVYSLSPGLFSPGGLAKHPMFANKDNIERYLATGKEFESANKEKSLIKFYAFMSHNNIASYDFGRAFPYAYGAAFSASPSKNAPYIDYPFYRKGKEIVIDSTIWKKWENGFGNLAEKTKENKKNLLKLKSFTIDYGTADEYSFIPEGCVYFSKLLKEAEISHKLVSFEGRHQDKLRERIEEHMLPFFSKMMHTD